MHATIPSYARLLYTHTYTHVQGSHTGREPGGQSIGGQRLCLYLCVCVCACVYQCVHACTHVCTYEDSVCTCPCMHACIHQCMHVCRDRDQGTDHFCSCISMLSRAPPLPPHPPLSLSEAHTPMHYLTMCSGVCPVPLSYTLSPNANQHTNTPANAHALTRTIPPPLCGVPQLQAYHAAPTESPTSTSRRKCTLHPCNVFACMCVCVHAHVCV